MTRRRWVGLAAAAAVAAAVAVPLATAEQTRSQRFFADKLLADDRTPAHIKTLLGEHGGGFVDASIAFTDLTGDEKDDAIVRVHTGGAGGVIAVYVFSTAAGGGLSPIFRSERLVRASTRVEDGVLSYRYARYQPGDELCCPSKLGEATLRWNASRKRMVVSRRQSLDGPKR